MGGGRGDAKEKGFGRSASFRKPPSIFGILIAGEWVPFSFPFYLFFSTARTGESRFLFSRKFLFSWREVYSKRRQFTSREFSRPKGSTRQKIDLRAQSAEGILSDDSLLLNWEKFARLRKPSADRFANNSADRFFCLKSLKSLLDTESVVDGSWTTFHLPGSCSVSF